MAMERLWDLVKAQSLTAQLLARESLTSNQCNIRPYSHSIVGRLLPWRHCSMRHDSCSQYFDEWHPMAQCTWRPAHKCAHGWNLSKVLLSGMTWAQPFAASGGQSGSRSGSRLGSRLGMPWAQQLKR